MNMTGAFLAKNLETFYIKILDDLKLEKNNGNKVKI